MFFITLFFFSLSALAYECAPETEQFADVEKLLDGVKSKKRDWFAAPEDKIKNAFCRKGYPTLAEQEKVIKTLSSGKIKESETINGIALRDTPEMLALFNELTTLSQTDDHSPEENVSLDKKFQIGSNCQTVRCAMGVMFGDKRATEMLYMKHRYGLNISPLVKNGMQGFSAAELEHLKKAIMDFPPHILPLADGKTCTRLHDDFSLGLGVLANATITFAKDWTKYSPERMQSTVFHEMAHNFGSEKNLDQDPDWLKISGWEQKEDDWSSSSEKFVSSYSAQNPYEDFAESMVAYRYDPEALKKASPEKYSFIKERVFAGAEYLSAKDCQKKNSLEVSIQKTKNARDRLDISKISPKMKKQLVGYCGTDSLEFFINRNYNKFNECLEGAIAIELAKEQFKKDNPKISSEVIENQIFSKLNGRSVKEANKVSLSKRQKDQIAKLGQSLMDEYELDAYKQIDLSDDYKNKEDYCRDFGDGMAYAYFSSLESDTKSGYLLFSRRADIQRRVHQKCVRLQTTFSEFRPFTEKDHKGLLR
jgi:hypothetical protein